MYTKKNSQFLENLETQKKKTTTTIINHAVRNHINKLTSTTPETSVPLSVPLGGKTDIMKIPRKLLA
jgi:hypothetical protein